jgi:hypothetical protein
MALPLPQHSLGLPLNLWYPVFAFVALVSPFVFEGSQATTCGLFLFSARFTAVGRNNGRRPVSVRVLEREASDSLFEKRNCIE